MPKGSKGLLSMAFPVFLVDVAVVKLDTHAFCTFERKKNSAVGKGSPTCSCMAVSRDWCQEDRKRHVYIA